MHVAVIGAGSWGTTIAMLAAGGAPTTLWARSDELVDEMRRGRENGRYLPGIAFPTGLSVESDLGKSVRGAELIFMAVPSHGFREVMKALRGDLAEGVPVISLTKGIEAGSDMRMTEVVTAEAPGTPAGVLSGPNLAREIASGQPAAAIAAHPDEGVARRIQELLHRSAFRVYTGSDVIGCEIAGATKNVIAIAAGISDGLGFGENTRAMLLTRGLNELARLGVALGGHTLTFGGLAGVGDLIATCTSGQSRNRAVGYEIGRGRSLEAVVGEMRMVAEGVKTAGPLVELANRHGVEMPIVGEVAAIVAGRTSPTEALGALMARPAGTEWEPVLRDGLHR